MPMPRSRHARINRPVRARQEASQSRAEIFLGLETVCPPFVELDSLLCGSEQAEDILTSLVVATSLRGHAHGEIIALRMFVCALFVMMMPIKIDSIYL